MKEYGILGSGINGERERLRMGTVPPDEATRGAMG